MANDAFTAGVKPGGLISVSEIRILLCYLIQNAPSPLSRAEIEQALLGEALVNYFELSNALATLSKDGLVEFDDDARYVLTQNGAVVADALMDDVPLTVRETALRASIQAQRFARKQAQHPVTINSYKNGYLLKGGIDDAGDTLLSLSLYLPSLASAELVKKNFIEHGSNIYLLVLAGVTGNKELLRRALSQLDDQT